MKKINELSENKKELIEEHQEFKSEDHLLECFFSEKLNKFCLVFNSKLFTFKTWNAFTNKRNHFIQNFNLSI